MNETRQLTGTQETPAVPRQAAGGAKQRDAFFDNAKYLAIVLVAIGHAWEPLRGDSRVASALYMAVYAFHMPAFIVISGYLSRSFDGRADRVQRLVTGVLVPYVVFQVAYTLVLRRLADGENDDTYVGLFEPRWLMWFLLALFIWRLTVPVWKAVRWPLPISLLVAAVATASPSLGSDLQIQRVLQFMPFFVLGLVLRQEHFQLVRRAAVRLLAVPVFAGALLVAYWAEPRLPYQWFYHKQSAQEFGEPWWMGPVMTLLMFGCAVVLIACFFALVPGRRMWFTALGAGTISGYLLHGFLARASIEWGWYDGERMSGIYFALPVTTAVAAVVITVLCTPPVRRLFKPVMEPRLDWLFRRGDRA